MKSFLSFAAGLAIALDTALAANESATTTLDLYILPVEPQQTLSGLQGSVVDVNNGSAVTKFAVELQPSETRTLAFNSQRSEWSYSSDGASAKSTVEIEGDEEDFRCSGDAEPPEDRPLSEYYVPVALTEGVELLAVKTTTSSTSASTPTPTDDDGDEESDDDSEGAGARQTLDVAAAGFAAAAFLAVL